MKTMKVEALLNHVKPPVGLSWPASSGRRIGFVLALVLGGGTMSALCGSLDSPAAPTNSASAMFTLQDLYNRLNTGAAGVKRTTVFAEPSAGPTIATMRTSDEVMAKAPVVNANAATAAEVLSGQAFWGLDQGAWGPRIGTMPVRGLWDGSTWVQSGYYEETDLTDVDPDLVPENIAENVTIFGVTGTLNNVDPFPSGGIIMWSGTSGNIPAGWVLCDGSNGAPDLRDRFIVGAGSTYAEGAVGGEATHVLTTAEMPSHNHSGYAIGGSGGGRINSGTFNMVSIGYTGGDQPHNNLPPYYALCFIMKQ